EVPVPDAFLRAGKREHQAFFAGAQRGVGAFALGDVSKRRDERALIMATEARDNTFHVDDGLIHRREPRFERPWSPAGKHLVDRLAHIALTIAVKALDERRAGQRTIECTFEEGSRGGVQKRDAIVLDNENALRNGIDKLFFLCSPHRLAGHIESLVPSMMSFKPRRTGIAKTKQELWDAGSVHLKWHRLTHGENHNANVPTPGGSHPGRRNRGRRQRAAERRSRPPGARGGTRVCTLDGHP